MSEITQDLDLALYAPLVSQLSYFLPIDNLDRNFLLRLLMDAKSDFAKRSLTQLTLQSVLTDLFELVVLWLHLSLGDALLRTSLAELLLRCCLRGRRKLDTLFRAFLLDKAISWYVTVKIVFTIIRLVDRAFRQIDADLLHKLRTV